MIFEADLKMIELELNMYEMDDACKEMDALRVELQGMVDLCVMA